MAKNIVVTDAKGNAIGSTYPKRARGLVKHGRAVYVDDCTIRLLHTTAPSVVTKNDNKEHFFMENIIEFKARDFRFGSQNKYGGRMFVTKNGSYREVFELGTVDDWKRQGAPGSRDHFGTWIFAKKDLEPHTDYVFRIEVVSDGTLCDGSELRAAIFDVLDPDDKTVYPLARSRFAPSVSKMTADGGLVRVFELPYSTGDGAEYQINIFAYDCRVTLDTPAAPEEYASLGDCSYAEWQNSRAAAKSEASVRMPSEEQIKKLIRYKELQEDGVLYEDDYERIKNTILGGLSDEIPIPDEPEESDPYDDAEFSFAEGNQLFNEEEFSKRIAKLDDGQSIHFGNISVKSGPERGKFYWPGYAADACTIEIGNGFLSTGAFNIAFAKLGDSGCISFANCKEAYDGTGIYKVDPRDGFTANFRNAEISNVTFANVLQCVGDGCTVNLINAKIKRAGEIVDRKVRVSRLLPSDIDGFHLNITNADIPHEIMEELRAEIAGTSNVIDATNLNEY